MIIKADPIASGARVEASGDFTVIPTVNTRKNVQINSTTHFAIGIGFSL
jgi:hypothetical protein